MRRSLFHSPRNTPPPSPPRHTFSESLMEENVDTAEAIISRWDLSNPSSNLTSIDYLFSPDHRHEAKHYLTTVTNLQNTMQSLVQTNYPGNEKMLRAQHLMQTAMKRLEKEFYQILKSNRDYLDPESVSTQSSIASRSSVSDFGDDDEVEESDEAVSGVQRASMAAMADLKLIADCMIGSGYAKECVKVYNIIRKSIVDEALYHLGVERSLTGSQIMKMDWNLLEVKIKNWNHAAKVSVKTLFYGERILCDQVFSVSASIRESCFTEVSRDSALALFGFAENVAKCKKSPEKMFRVLDLYETISDLWPEIESIFSYESTATVRSTAVNALVKLGDAARAILTEFELAIQKDTSKSAVPGGGVHPLTRYVMNYVSFLADYSEILSDIVADWPLEVKSPLPESYMNSPDTGENFTSPISLRLAWLILVLLCKLDSKTGFYKDVAQSYLFLANNLQYIVGKVRNSNLSLLLGGEWTAAHQAKLRQYAANYERMGWSKVIASLPENPTAEMPLDRVKDHFRRFNAAFEETYTKQVSWVIPDPGLRDEFKISLARNICASYRELYEKYGARLKKQMWVESLVRFTPDDLGNYLSDLFHGSGGAGSVSSNSSH